MARLEIKLPSPFVFSTEIAVRVSDLNYGGHVGHDRILTLMQEARVLYYRSIGFKDEISFTDSVGQIISHAAVQYRAESFLGDTLIFNIGIDEISKYSFEMFYQVLNKVDGREIARGQTGIYCFDYAKRKVASIPDVLLQKISRKQN